MSDADREALSRWWWDATIRACVRPLPPRELPTPVMVYPSVANDPHVPPYAQTPGPPVEDVLGVMSLSRLRNK